MTAASVAVDPARDRSGRVVPIAVPSPGPAPRAWAYLLVGDPLTLVDPGPDTDAAYAAIRDGLARTGLGIGALRRIVLTHAHPSHAGLSARLHDDAGARVAAHPLAVGALADAGVARASRRDLVDRAAAAGAVPEAVREAFHRWVETRVEPMRSLPSDALDALADGGALEGTASGWRVHHAPGHSPDHLMLHHAGVGAALTGDLLLREAPTIPQLEPRRPDGTRPATFDDLVASWRRLGRLPCRLVLPAHGAPIRAHRVLLARRLAEARAALSATRDAVREGATTLWAVVLATGLPPDGEHLEASLAQAVAWLDALVRRGLVERRTVDGQLRFSVRR